MDTIYYKIGEAAEMLGIEQHTMRYLEHTLRLKIKRDERGDRMYTEADIETLRLILMLKNEKGLNSTAIRMALATMEESQETAVQTFQPAGASNADLLELKAVLNRIAEQNDELISQNKQLQQRIEQLETKMRQRDTKKDEQVDELIRLWRREQEDRGKSWLAKLTGK